MKNFHWPAISIVIANWNGVHLLKQTMDSILKAQNAYPGDCETIIVDNGSMDRSIDILKDFYPEVRILALDKNYGFSKASNEGVNIAINELIFFLNNDIKIKEDILIELAKPFQENPELFSTTPMMNHWDGHVLTDNSFSSAISFSVDKGNIVQKFAISFGKPTVQSNTFTFYGSGGALLVNKEKFNKIGQFHEVYSPSYWEDTDLCLKAWKYGWPSVYVPSGVCWHKVSATSNREVASFRVRKNFYVFYWLNVSKISLLLQNLYHGFFDSMERYLNGDATWKAYFSFLKNDFVKVIKLKAKYSSKEEKLTIEEVVDKTKFSNIEVIEVSFLLKERRNAFSLIFKLISLYFLRVVERLLIKTKSGLNKIFDSVFVNPIQKLKMKVSR